MHIPPKFSCFPLTKVFGDLANLARRVGVSLDAWSPAFDIRVRNNAMCTGVLAAPPRPEDPAMYLRINVDRSSDTVVDSLVRFTAVLAAAVESFASHGVADAAIGFRKHHVDGRREAWFTYTSSSMAWTMRSPPSDVIAFNGASPLKESSLANVIRHYDLGTYVATVAATPGLCSAKDIVPGIRYWPCKHGLMRLELP